jgi:hypothetical protein
MLQEVKLKVVTAGDHCCIRLLTRESGGCETWMWDEATAVLSGEANTNSSKWCKGNVCLFTEGMHVGAYCNRALPAAGAATAHMKYGFCVIMLGCGNCRHNTLKELCVLVAGELFAECPLPADGTPLTTVSTELDGTSVSCCSSTQCDQVSLPQQHIMQRERVMSAAPTSKPASQQASKSARQAYWVSLHFVAVVDSLLHIVHVDKAS